MKEKIKILELPFPSTTIIEGPILCTDGADLLLSMNFDDYETNRSICLRFVKVRALQKRAEIYCTVWHIDAVYDTVCEVQTSAWVQELRSDSVPEWRDRWIMRHFMIYIDSFGCIEVVAESVVFDDGVKNSGGT